MSQTKKACKLIKLTLQRPFDVGYNNVLEAYLRLLREVYGAAPHTYDEEDPHYTKVHARLTVAQFKLYEAQFHQKYMRQFEEQCDHVRYEAINV